MPADTTVKFLHSAMTGAPSLTSSAGTLIAVLDACLINGFGTGNVDSIVVANNLATVTRSVGHPMEVGTVALIAGATPAGLNGEKKVLSITTTTYTFDATGISNQTATGTITHKVSPLGWEKPFSSTNLAAYRSLNLQSTRAYLRVDDTFATASQSSARLVGYESMVDINTGTGPFPSASQFSGGVHWVKYTGGDATAKSWVVVGDDRTFYFFMNFQTNSEPSVHMQSFGDLISVKASDPYAVYLTGQQGAGNFNESGYPDQSMMASRRGQAAYCWTARSATGIGGSSTTRRVAPILGASCDDAKSGQIGLIYPNTANNALYFVPMYCQDVTPYSLRGRFPGINHIDANVLQIFAHRSYLSGITGQPGKVFRIVTGNSSSNSTVAFDTTGPWR